MSLLSGLIGPGPDDVRADLVRAVGNTLRRQWLGPPGARGNVPAEHDDSRRGRWWQAFQRALDQVPDAVVRQVVREVRAVGVPRDQLRYVCALELYVFVVDVVHWLVPADEVLDLVDGPGSGVLVAVVDDAFTGLADTRREAVAEAGSPPLVGWTPVPNEQELQRRYIRGGECPHCSYGLTLGAYQLCRQCHQPNAHGVWADPDLNRPPAVLA